MKNVAMTMLGALALAGLSACNIPLTSDYIYPVTMARAGPSLSDEIRTAAPGEIILAQTVAHPGLLTLENQVTPAERVWQGIVTFYPRMEPGLRLYPALRVGKERRYVACSVDAVTTRQGGVGPETYAVCLDLPDGAVLVVRPGQPVPANATQIGGPLWLADGAQAHSGFVYWSTGELAQGSEGANFTLTEPAQLNASSAASEATGSGAIRVALRYMADQTGARLEAIYLTGEQQAQLTLAPVAITPGDTFPRVVQIGGAEVELLAIRDGVLAYRLRRNFPSDRLIISNLPG